MLKGLNLFEKRLKSHHDSSGLVNKYIKGERFDNEKFKELLEVEPNRKEKAIYVHTPYCDKICSFCNLNREQVSGSLDLYAKYLADEFDKYGKTNYFKKSKFEVIFFGGGTPTVFKTEQLKLILESIKRNVTLTEDYEFTFETTLHNLTKEKLELMMSYGVNRLSVGVQTFSTNGRKFYNRTYEKDEVIERLKELKSVFKGDVCVDIIYNYPDEKIEDVISDAKIIKELEISSASFYSLMVHNGSKLSYEIAEEKVQLEESVEKDYTLYQAFVSEMLKDGDYHILELTKIAKNGGDKYKYIKIRNSGGDTFPIGVGAGGTVQGIGIFRMSKGVSFFSKNTVYHEKFSKLSGIMQFPTFSKKDIKAILTDEEFSYFCERMKDFEKDELIIEEMESFNFTHMGIFWGNNIINVTISYILEKVFNKQSWE